MQRSSSQKVLLVLSIISIVMAVLALVGGLVVMLGGSFFGAVDSAEVSEALSDTGVTQGELGAFAGLFGFAVVIASVIDLVVGILGVRAANDNQKIMPVWILAIIGVVMDVIGLISTITNGSFGTSGFTAIISLVVSVLMFWIANNIKQEAGK